MRAALAGVALFPVTGFAYEIYSTDMQDSYETAQSTDAPCSNWGYYSHPPIYDMGSCLSCKASIKRAKSELNDYNDTCTHTHEVEATAAAGNLNAASSTISAQFSADLNAGNAQSVSAAGEDLKRQDGSHLSDKGKACQRDVNCIGNIAPEDIDAGKKEKAACASFTNGADLVVNEKTSYSSQMTGLNGQDTTNLGNLNQLGSGGSVGAGADAGVGASAGAGAAGLSASAGIGIAAAGAALGTGIFAASNYAGGPGGGIGSGTIPSLGGGLGSATALGGSVGKVSAALTWSDYMNFMKTGASPALSPATAAGNALLGGTPASASLGDTSPAAQALNGGAATGPTGSSRAAPASATADAAPAIPGLIEKSHYSDAWLDYAGADNIRRLAEKLKEDPQLREKLKQKIEELLSEEDAEPGRDAARKERIEYYRTALAEADRLLKQGSLKALAPLDAKEVFSMDEEGTKREVQRLLAGMNGSGDDSPYALFPRVHRALWRQVGMGNIKITRKKIR